MSTLFAKLDERGRVIVLNEKGQANGRTSVSSGYVGVQVNGETIAATTKTGKVEFLDKGGAYTGRHA